MLSGEVWKGMSINLDLDNVTVELLIAHQSQGCEEASLACLEFIRSRLMFDSYSDQSKDIDLVSHAIKAHDTRYRGESFLQQSIPWLRPMGWTHYAISPSD